MIKNLGNSLYQIFPVQNILWGNVGNGTMAVQMKTEGGRIIMSVDKEDMIKAFSKVEYIALSGQFINVNKIDKVHRRVISGNVLYNIIFQDVTINDDILITEEDFDNLKEKFISI